jgi:hypothetical protein
MRRRALLTRVPILAARASGTPAAAAQGKVRYRGRFRLTQYEKVTVRPISTVSLSMLSPTRS